MLAKHSIVLSSLVKSPYKTKMLKYDEAGMYIKGMKNENEHIERGKIVRLDAVAVTLLFVAGTVFSLLCENYWLIALSYVPFYVFLTYKFFFFG